MSLRAILFLSFSYLLTTALYGQIDSNYWTHQYGAKGLLLNGAVIASSDGETSIFYNPGSIGMDDNLGFAFSFLSPSYASLETTNFIGDGNIITDDGLSFAPGFLGVRFKPFKSDRIVAAVTAFERFKTDIRYKDRVVDKVNNGNILLFRGDLDFTRKISEDWYGLGLFYKLSDRMGIGVTQFSVWHNQKVDFNLKKEIVPRAIPNEILLGWRTELGYNLNVSSGFITKLGWCYRHDKFNLGLTFTSPIYGIIRKSADYFIEDNRVDIASEPDILTTSSNRDVVDLDNFNSTYAVGFGLDGKLGGTVLSFSMEYFSPLDRYRLFEGTDDSFDGLALEPEETFLELSSQTDRVINVGVGILNQTSEKLTLLAGFRTDFDQNNSLTINQSTEYLGTTGDVYHISGGGMFKFGKNQVSLGLDIGYGTKQDGKQLADLSNLSQQNIFEITGQNNVSSRFFSAMLFLTYDFLFYGFTNKDEREK